MTLQGNVTQMSETRALKRIFRSKRGYAAGTYRKLQNDELRRMRWEGHVARMWKLMNACKSEGKTSLARPDVTWKNSEYYRDICTFKGQRLHLHWSGK
jgi:hypothetical protein